MHHSNERIIKHKIGLLNLAKKHGNVAKTFKMKLVVHVSPFDVIYVTASSMLRWVKMLTKEIEIPWILMSLSLFQRF